MNKCFQCGSEVGLHFDNEFGIWACLNENKCGWMRNKKNYCPHHKIPLCPHGWALHPKCRCPECEFLSLLKEEIRKEQE